MPWQNNSDGGPWSGGGSGSGSGSDQGGESGGGAGGGSGEGGSPPPRNPWGDNPPKRPPGPRAGSGNRDLDALIRRGQDTLRAAFPGGGGDNGLPNVEWSWVAGALLLAWVLFTSFYRVDTQERGVVMRFGRFVEVTDPGLHFKLPWPIDSVTFRKVEQINSVDIGAGDGASENLVLTGDQNLINLAYAVRWKIKNPELFLFSLKEPEQTIREVAESVMRAEMSHATLNAAIGPQRAQVADQVREHMQDVLDSYHSGVEIRGVDIKQADPPAAVDAAFKDVLVAQQDAQKYLNEARAYAQQQINSAQGATAQFDAVYAQYKLAPEVTRKRIYLETMEQVLSKVDKTVIDAPVTTYLPLSEIQRRAKQAPAPAQ